MRKWLLYLRPNWWSAPLHVGSRINTKYGEGIVIGGCIHVKLDRPTPMSRDSGQPNNCHHSFNLEELDAQA